MGVLRLVHPENAADKIMQTETAKITIRFIKRYLLLSCQIIIKTTAFDWRYRDYKKFLRFCQSMLVPKQVARKVVTEFVTTIKIPL